jgi:hypothetical protein
MIERLIQAGRIVRVMGLAVAFFLLSAGADRALAASIEDATPPPVSGRRLSAPETILSADVLARIQMLRQTIDLVRGYMGKPESPPALMRVEGVRPMEVYSQALNLQLRANRLAFERVRVVRRESMPISGEANPSDVFAVVDASLASVLMVKRHLGIDEAVGEEIQPESTTPSEVFNSAIAAGSELENLLEQRTSPSDVFQQVTAAVHTAASLHTIIPDGPNLPEEPDFEPNKMPSDIYIRMQNCYALVRVLAERRGLMMLNFELSEQRARQVTPSDVSDLSSLVVRELLSIHALFPGARAPTQAYYPGARFPAHVYQRAGLLEAILQDLVAGGGGDT